MKIIIRSCGERTENQCIKLAKKHGQVEVVNASPFGETLRQSYELAGTFNQPWVPMIDADVLLYPGTLKTAITMLKANRNNIFCWDGSTKDKIMMKKRRAGVHIYKSDLLPDAMQYIEDNRLKPESHVRKEMQKNYGAVTHAEGFLFGMHDFEQYYRDLWRKAFAQSRKLAGMLRRSPNIIRRWRMLGMRDADYSVIYEAHKKGRMFKGEIVIDSRKTYGAAQGLRKLGLKEKGRLV